MTNPTSNIPDTTQPGNMEQTTDFPVAAVLGTSIAAVVLVLVGAAVFCIYRKSLFPRTHFHRQSNSQANYQTCEDCKQCPNLYTRKTEKCNHDLCLQLEETLDEHSGEQNNSQGSNRFTKPLKSILKKTSVSDVNSCKTDETKVTNEQTKSSHLVDACTSATCRHRDKSRDTNMAAHQCCLHAGVVENAGHSLNCEKHGYLTGLEKPVFVISNNGQTTNMTPKQDPGLLTERF